MSSDWAYSTGSSVPVLRDSMVAARPAFCSGAALALVVWQSFFSADASPVAAALAAQQALFFLPLLQDFSTAGAVEVASALCAMETPTPMNSMAPKVRMVFFMIVDGWLI